MEPEVLINIEANRGEFDQEMKDVKIQSCLLRAINAFESLNKYFQDRQPWDKKWNDDKQQRLVVIRSALEGAYIAAHLMSPCKSLLQFLALYEI